VNIYSIFVIDRSIDRSIMPGNNKSAVNERRQKLFTLLTRGMKGYEIAKELKVTGTTVSRDIHYLTSQSQNYLNDLAKETMPFMYQTSIEGIRSVLKECRNIYMMANNPQRRITTTTIGFTG
jgi:predicted transcriptional regulator